MTDFIFDSFYNFLLEDKVEEKGLNIKPLNFENFQAELINEGKMELRSVAHLFKWAKEIMQQTAHTFDFIINYHPDSPKRNWNKLKKEEGKYTLGLDLEKFMDSKHKLEQRDKIEELSFFIPDNYELAKKVMKEFRKTPENKIYKITDVSYRDTAMWETTDKLAATALVDFIEEKYVRPYLDEILKSNKIS